MHLQEKKFYFHAVLLSQFSTSISKIQICQDESYATILVAMPQFTKFNENNRYFYKFLVTLSPYLIRLRQKSNEII